MDHENNSLIKPDLINYGHLATAIKLYERRGYERVNVPWIVSMGADLATKPNNSKPFVTFCGNLVASAEQSFIQMMLDSQIDPQKPDQRFMAVTPCFRDEHPLTEHNRQSFIKLELIHVNPTSPDKQLSNMIDDAWWVMHHLGAEPYLIETEDGYDLYDHHLEIGSYGYRERFGMRWLYGTGLAEPRFSQALERQHV